MSSELKHRIRRILERATPQIRRPAIIGAIVLLILAGLAALGMSRTDSPFSMPSALGGEAVSNAVWGLKPDNLLMVLPMGAFLVVLARSFIGLKAFGLFTPMLIALAFLQIGPVFGPVVLISSVTVGMIIAPSLLRLRMTRVGFLGVLISLVVLVLTMLQEILDRELQVDAFPVVVCALVVERWWKQWEKDGWWTAARIAGNTFVLALAIEFVIVSHVALALIDISPMVLPALSAVAIAILGRYRGLRLTEIGRFAPLWLEGNRNERAKFQELQATKPEPPPPKLPQRKAHPQVGRARDEPCDWQSAFADIAVLQPIEDVRITAAFGPKAKRAGDRRHSGDQSAQRDHCQVQSAQGDRPGPGQGGDQGGAERARYRHDRNDLRRLRVWRIDAIRPGEDAS